MPRRRPASRNHRRVGLSGILLFLGLAVACLGIVYLAVRGWGGADPGSAPETISQATEPASPAVPRAAPRRTEPAQPAAVVEPATATPAGSEPEAARIPAAEPGEPLPPVPPPNFEMPEPEVPPPGTRVAVVIDDLGRSMEDVRTLRELGVPLSYAVLPFETRTPEVVDELNRRGEEILLHLPMEAAGPVDPGPGALRTGMKEAELVDGTRAALDAVPGAVGVNNHMGSLLSADDRSMRAVLSVVSERGLYFLDSRTSVETVGYRLASSLGIPSAERQVFLDRDTDARLVTYQFRRLLELARTRGSAVAIGHPHPVTLEVLTREIPRAIELGYELVPVSYLLERPGGLAR